MCAEFEARLLALAGRERDATIALMPVFQFTLFASFCIFPPTSLAIFKCFRCDEVSDGAKGVWYLAADYSIRCGGAAYAANMAYACAMVAVYPLGVPLSYCCLLYRYRHVLNPVAFVPLPGAEKLTALERARALSALDYQLALVAHRAGADDAWPGGGADEPTATSTNSLPGASTKPRLAA